MVQIKVTPERLEQSAKLVLETKNRLEQIHKDLYNQTEYVASMWNGQRVKGFIRCLMKQNLKCLMCFGNLIRLQKN
ncbi:TPA: WXG100 family type VII secretion target [Bacillus paranthracis]